MAMLIPITNTQYNRSTREAGEVKRGDMQGGGTVTFYLVVPERAPVAIVSAPVGVREFKLPAILFLGLIL